VTGAELAARRTAAAAVLADYQREAVTADVAGRAMWGARLADMLALLLATDGGLSPEQLAVTGQALADALAYRGPQGSCPDCDAHPAGLCSDHGDDLDKTDAYIALARDLGLEIER
jgi:hypothetical protein